MSDRLKEIFRLRDMLDKAGVKYEFINRSDDFPFGFRDVPEFEYYQILIPDVISVIEGYGTYGAGADLLEIMKLSGNSTHGVSGWLSAEQVFEAIRTEKGEKP